MGLRLNEHATYYKEFYGKYHEQLPRLRAEGFTPLSIEHLMRRRIEVLTADSKVRDAWWDDYFDTTDGAAFHPDGRAKIVLDAEPLTQISPYVERSLKGEYLLLHDTFNKLEGLELTAEEIEKYHEIRIPAPQAASNPIWQHLARDQTLLNDYVDAVSKMAESHGEPNNMTLYFSSRDSHEQPIIRPVGLSYYGGRAAWVQSNDMTYRLIGGVGTDSKPQWYT